MPKTKLNCHNRQDRKQSMTKTKHDKDVTNRIGAIYVEIEIEMS